MARPMLHAPPPALPRAALTAQEACRLCRSAPPLPRNEAPGVVRASGALCIQTLAAAPHVRKTFDQNLMTTPWASSRNHPDRIAPLEGGAVQEISSDARFCIIRRDARLLGLIVRHQICKPVAVYVSKVVLE